MVSITNDGYLIQHVNIGEHLTQHTHIYIYNIYIYIYIYYNGAYSAPCRDKNCHFLIFAQTHYEKMYHHDPKPLLVNLNHLHMASCDSHMTCNIQTQQTELVLYLK